MIKPNRTFLRVSLLALLTLSLVSAARLAGVSGVHLQNAHATFPGANGEIAFVSDKDGNSEIYSTNSDGSGLTRLTNNPATDVLPSWSPDGTKIAFMHTGQGYSNLYVMNSDGSGVKLLTNSTTNHYTDIDSDPSWSPDGTKIVFDRLNNGVRSIFVMNSDGTGVKPLAGVTTSNFDPRWSPDGTKIVFAAGKANGGIYVVNLDGSGLAKLTSSGQKPDWSPDGTRIVFSANGTLLITNSDGRSGFETLPSFSGGEFPRWSPDGTKILFSKGDGLYVVDLEAGRSNLTKIYDEIPSTFVGSPDWQRLLGKQSTLTVKSQDPDGNPITGYWTVLYDSNGSVLNTGFTPATFTLNSGQQYKIGMGDYGSYSFDHWLDNLSAQNPRNISGNSNAQLIAIYKNANAFPIIHMQDKTESYGVPISPDSNHQIAAEWVKPLSALVGKKIDSVTLKLQRIDNPTGAAQIVVFDVNKNVKKSFGSILAGVGAGSTYHSDIPTTMTEIEFRLPSSDPGYTIQADDRIGILWSGGSANAGSISVMMDKVISDSLFDGTNTQRIRGTPTGWYSSDTGEDLWMVLKQTHG